MYSIFSSDFMFSYVSSERKVNSTSEEICKWFKRSYILMWFCSKLFTHITWWRHEMETFSALLAICVGNSPIPGKFPAQRPVTRSFDVFFDLRLNKRLSKQSWGWWFEMPLCPLWRHCNDSRVLHTTWTTIRLVTRLNTMGKLVIWIH